MSEISNSFEGECYCGQFRFKVQNNPPPNLCVYCHCESCRRAHSSPLYQVCYIPEKCFQITQGVSKQFGKTKEGVQRFFCPNCGTRLFNILPQKPQLGIGFFPALLNDDIQKNLPIQFKPTYHYSSHESVLNLECLNDNFPRK